MWRADRLSLLGAIRSELSPPVAAIGIKGNACRVRERPSPGATRVGDPEPDSSRGHFAEQSRGDAVVAEHDLGVTVKAARDLIVMELDFPIPVIHQLGEVRERQPVQL